MNYLVFKSNDSIKVQMLTKALDNEQIPYRLNEAGISGVHGGLGFVQESLIYINETDVEIVKEMISAFGF